MQKEKEKKQETVCMQLAVSVMCVIFIHLHFLMFKYLNSIQRGSHKCALGIFASLVLDMH